MELIWSVREWDSCFCFSWEMLSNNKITSCCYLYNKFLLIICVCLPVFCILKKHVLELSCCWATLALHMMLDWISYQLQTVQSVVRMDGNCNPTTSGQPHVPICNPQETVTDLKCSVINVIPICSLWNVTDAMETVWSHTRRLWRTWCGLVSLFMLGKAEAASGC